MQKILSFLLVLSFLAFIVILTIFPIEDGDIWHHLAYGRWMVEHNFKTSPVNPFVWSQNLRETNYEWASEIVVFLLQKQWGVNSITIIKSIFISAYFLILLFTASKMNVSLWISIPILTVGILASAERFFERFENIGYFFLVLELSIFYLYQKVRINLLYFLPLIFLIWIHTHGSFMIGLVILWIFAGLNVLEMRKKTLIVVIITGICTLAILTHPSRLDIFRQMLNFIPGFKTETSFLISKTYEFQPPFSPQFRNFVFVRIFGGIILIYWLLFIYGVLKEKGSWFGFLCLLIGSLLGLSSVRHINLFIILGFLPVVSTLNNPSTALRTSTKGKLNNLNNTAEGLAKLILILVFTLASVMIVRNGYKLGTTYRRFGLGTNPITPTGVVKFLDENNIKGNLLNQLEIGSDLAWLAFPKQKVFIDGFGFYPEWFFKEYLSMSESIEKMREILDKYKIDYVLTLYPENTSGKSVPDYLSISPEWALVYWDNYYLLYLRRQENFANVIDQTSYRFADPLKLTRQSFVERLGKEEGVILRNKITEELRKNLAGNAQNAKAHLYLGSMLEGSGDFDGAIKEYVQAIRFDPDNLLSNLLISGILVKKQQFKQAAEILHKALAKNPNMPSAYLVLGQIEEKDKHYKEAERYYKKALALEPRLAVANLRLGIIYAYSIYDKNLARKNLLRALELGLPDDQARLAREALSAL